MVLLELLDAADLAKHPDQEGDPLRSDAPTGCAAPTVDHGVHCSEH